MITSISPLDGRYQSKVSELENYFSEYALIKYRVHVEIEWFILLHDVLPDLNSLNQSQKEHLRNIYINLDSQKAESVKEIEKTTNHDVKAIEYFIKDELKELPEFKDNLEYVHFACTSEDINNLSYALMIRDSLDHVVKVNMKSVIDQIVTLADNYKSVSMLSRTHGQTASPTTIGKEFINVAYRLFRKYKALDKLEILGKINGAVGNFNAHLSAYPDLDWFSISKEFITERLNLSFNPLTTQIEPHDFVAEICHVNKEFNTILIDFDRDIWGYISLGYFKQKLKAGEIGSSTMPHKVNPIDFENSEGNLGIANSLFGHFAEKLPISRWQRDLTDSTVFRNIGIAFGYSILAYKNSLKGLSKLELNDEKVAQDLDLAWEVLAEPIQTVMRRYKIANAYEKLKDLTRGRIISKASIQEFIESLELPKEEITRLVELSPASYIGLAEKLVDEGKNLIRY